MGKETANPLRLYDFARDNREYWEQWANNSVNLALQHCQSPFSGICNTNRAGFGVHLRDQALCLDCHGALDEIASYVFRCERCKVIHGFSGGSSSPYARFHRSGLLIVKRANMEHDFSASCVLSQYPPFQKWLRRRSGD